MIRFHTCVGGKDREGKLYVRVCVHSCLTRRPMFVANLDGAAGQNGIDCEYTVISITITAKVAPQSVKNDLSILSRKQKHTQASLPSSSRSRTKLTANCSLSDNPRRQLALPSSKHLQEHQSFDLVCSLACTVKAIAHPSSAWLCQPLAKPQLLRDGRKKGRRR